MTESLLPLFKDPHTEDPLLVNEKGVKFWLHKELTDWARRANKNGTVLNTAAVFRTEQPNGYRELLLTIDNEAYHACQSGEAMACHIDMLKLLKEKKDE